MLTHFPVAASLVSGTQGGSRPSRQCVLGPSSQPHPEGPPQICRGPRHLRGRVTPRSGQRSGGLACRLGHFPPPSAGTAVTAQGPQLPAPSQDRAHSPLGGRDEKAKVPSHGIRCAGSGGPCLTALPLWRGCETPKGKGQGGVPRGASVRRMQVPVGARPSSAPAPSSSCRCPLPGRLETGATGAPVGSADEAACCVLWTRWAPGASGLGTALGPTTSPAIPVSSGPLAAYTTATPPHPRPAQRTLRTPAPETPGAPEGHHTPTPCPLHKHQPARCPGRCWRAGGHREGTAGWAWFQGLLIQAGKATAAGEQISNDAQNAKLGVSSGREGAGGWDRAAWGPRASTLQRTASEDEDPRPGFTVPYGTTAQGSVSRGRGLKVTAESPAVGLWVEELACLSLWAAGRALGRRDLILPSS